jgi:hypothetical protein
MKLAVCAALVLSTALATAQERKRYDAVLATVNGAAITESEVDEFAQILGPSAGSTETILRELVLTRLESDAAAEAGVKVPDDVLNDEMLRRTNALGGADAYKQALIAFGRSAEQDREFVRKRLAARAWVDATVGLVPNSPLLRPELARSVRVTPDETRAFFAANRASMQSAKVRTVAYAVLHENDFASDAEANGESPRIARERRRDARPRGGRRRGGHHALRNVDVSRRRHARLACRGRPRSVGTAARSRLPSRSIRARHCCCSTP